MLFHKKEKRRLWPYALLVFFVLVGGAAVWAYRWVKNLTPETVFENSLVQQIVRDQADEQGQKLFALLPQLLGIESPKTYLILFENNTELRPAGGFIGAYAVARVSNGDIEVLKIEGTETLDRQTPETWIPGPPAPITEHLGVDRWYFRDSNWSPGFAESAQKALELYRGEGGLLANDIDVVLAITPTVLEELLRISGPVSVEGITFDAANVTETLEYEVEYGYAERGIVLHERKRILEPFARVLIDRIKKTLLPRAGEYIETFAKLAEEKQILFYSPKETLQREYGDLGISGVVTSTGGDYLLWADANLAALKTDHAIQRNLTYSFEKRRDGRYVATTSMEYAHTGTFDWRTTRYRTYARVFVPRGSELVSVEGAMKTDRSAEPGTVDMGQELGKQWFGSFTSIEPGTTSTLSFIYLLPDAIGKQIENGLYTLFVQKQSGTIAHGLTLDLNFDTTISAATPAERQGEWGDEVYRVESVLRVDRGFTVEF